MFEYTWCPTSGMISVFEYPVFFLTSWNFSSGIVVIQDCSPYNAVNGTSRERSLSLANIGFLANAGPWIIEKDYLKKSEGVIIIIKAPAEQGILVPCS